MNVLRGSLAVFWFESRRSLTLSRLACWSVLALFPPTIFGILAHYDVELPDERFWIGMLYWMIPGVIALLGLLLWATPAVSTELEGKTWIYLAVRPAGRDCVLVGKYLAAVAWSALAAWLGLTLSVAIIARDYELPQPLLLWAVLTGLLGLSCLAYGALYCFLGVVFRKRAMVIAVAYTLIFEFVVGLVPALINKFTVQYRLRSLLVKWLDLEEWRQAGIFGNEAVWAHLVILLAYAVVLIVASAVVLRLREHTAKDET
jgi:ABC-type transport system involved in multi-copper enzyme maturation permease subunit